MGKPSVEVVEESVLQTGSSDPTLDGLDDELEDSEADESAAVRWRRSKVGSLTSQNRLKAGLLVAAAATVVACVSISTAQLMDIRTEDREASLRDSATQTAEDVVLKLTSIKADTAQQSIDEIRTLSTGVFKDQFSQQAPTVVSALSESKVDAEGRIVDSGIVSASDNNAEVLVAVDATVRNTEAPDGEGRQFRIKVSMLRDEGRWLASNLEFVA